VSLHQATILPVSDDTVEVTLPHGYKCAFKFATPALRDEWKQQLVEAGEYDKYHPAMAAPTEEVVQEQIVEVDASIETSTEAEAAQATPAAAAQEPTEAQPEAEEALPAPPAKPQAAAPEETPAEASAPDEAAAKSEAVESEASAPAQAAKPEAAAAKDETQPDADTAAVQPATASESDAAATPEAAKSVAASEPEAAAETEAKEVATPSGNAEESEVAPPPPPPPPPEEEDEMPPPPPPVEDEMETIEEAEEETSIALVQTPLEDKLAASGTRMQRKAFSVWINQLLAGSGVEIQGRLEAGLADGRIINALLAKLAQLTNSAPIEEIPAPKSKISGSREQRIFKARMRRLDNLITVFRNLERLHVGTVNIGAVDIADGSTKLVLGLVWNLICRFHSAEATHGPSCSDDHDHAAHQDVDDSAHTQSFRTTLLGWVRDALASCGDQCHGEIANFSESFRDGLALCAIISHYVPQALDFHEVEKLPAQQRLERVFAVARSELGVMPMLDPEDFLDEDLDDKCVMAYVATIRDAVAS